MLSDAEKEAIKNCVAELIRRFGNDAVIKAGPVEIVEGFINGGGTHQPDEASECLIENRKEAEQIVAGLLGLC